MSDIANGCADTPHPGCGHDTDGFLEGAKCVVCNFVADGWFRCHVRSVGNEGEKINVILRKGGI